jgi:hypothetical protein
MQRAPAFLVLLLSLLYFGAGTLAMRAAVAQEEAPPSIQGPHIAVLVPLKSPALGRVADAVRRGVLEAQRVHAGTGLPVVVLASGEDPYEIIQAYEGAVRAGARLVIGPLTRSAVSVIASSHLVSVPTLALNAPETDVPLPYNLYLFGMQVEYEARQIAQLAAQQGRRRALLVASESPLSKRLSEAFRVEWTERGNQIEDEFSTPPTSPASVSCATCSRSALRTWCSWRSTPSGQSSSAPTWACRCRSTPPRWCTPATRRSPTSS